MEAALCDKRAIALSFGSKEKQPLKTIEAACALSVRLVEHLAQEWHAGVEFYNVNVPMVANVEKRPVYHGTSSRVCWSKSSLFRELKELDDRNEMSLPPRVIRSPVVSLHGLLRSRILSPLKLPLE